MNEKVKQKSEVYHISFKVPKQVHEALLAYAKQLEDQLGSTRTNISENIAAKSIILDWHKLLDKKGNVKEHP